MYVSQINPLSASVALNIETSQLICTDWLLYEMQHLAEMGLVESNFSGSIFLGFYITLYERH